MKLLMALLLTSNLSFAFDPQNLVVVGLPGWSTDAVFHGFSPYPLGGDAIVTNCKVAPRAGAKWSGLGSTILRNVHLNQCVGSVNLISVTVPGEITSYLKFNDRISRTSVAVPGLRTDISKHPEVRAGGASNGAFESTFIVIIDASGAGSLWRAFAVTPDGNTVGAGEVLTVPANGYVFHKMTTVFDSGAVLLKRGLAVGCVGCDVAGSAYGFVITGPVTGETTRATPFEASNTIKFP